MHPAAWVVFVIVGVVTLIANIVRTACDGMDVILNNNMQRRQERLVFLLIGLAIMGVMIWSGILIGMAYIK